MLTTRKPFTAIWFLPGLIALAGCGGQIFPGNRRPVVSSLVVAGVPIVNPDGTVINPNLIIPVNTGSTITCSAIADDPDRDVITLAWQGAVAVTGSTTLAQVDSAKKGPLAITLVVTDVRNGVTAITVHLLVEDPGSNHSPTAVMAEATKDVVAGATLAVKCNAMDTDPDDKLTYFFTAASGQAAVMQDTTDPSKATYTAPAAAGKDTVYCVVSDGKGAYVTAVETITVKAK
jgi:hypothetical protein